MNLGLFRRENLQSGDAKMVGDATVDQFQRTHGALTAWQETEHTDDGSHTDIHATSIVVDPGGITATGDIASVEGGFTGEGGQVALGDLPISKSTPGMSGGMGVQIGKWRIISDEQNSPSSPSFPGLIFQYLPEVLGNFLFRFIRLGTYDYALAPQTGLQLALGWGANRLSNVITALLTCVGNATVGGRLDVSGDAIITGNVQANTLFSINWVRANDAFYEQSRGLALGYWQDVPMGSLSFFCVTPGTPWFVGAGSYLRYTRIGRTIIFDYSFLGGNVPAGAGTILAVRTPTSLFQFDSATFLNSVAYATNAGVLQEMYCQVASGDLIYFINKNFGAFGPTPNGTRFTGVMTAGVYPSP